jgi:hypothetical protein
MNMEQSEQTRRLDRVYQVSGRTAKISPEDTRTELQELSKRLDVLESPKPPSEQADRLNVDARKKLESLLKQAEYFCDPAGVAYHALLAPLASWCVYLVGIIDSDRLAPPPKKQRSEDDRQFLSKVDKATRDQEAAIRQGPPPEKGEHKPKPIALDDPVLCNHANECPAQCTCPPTCYCKTHTCKPPAPVDEGLREIVKRVVSYRSRPDDPSQKDVVFRHPFDPHRWSTANEAGVPYIREYIKAAIEAELARREQQHKREVLEARIEELNRVLLRRPNFTALTVDAVEDQIANLTTQLAALPKGTP